MEYNIYKYNIIRFHSRRYFMPAGAHTYIIVPYVFPRLSRWAVLSALTLGTCTYIIRRLEIRFHYTGTRQSVYGFIDTFIYVHALYWFSIRFSCVPNVMVLPGKFYPQTVVTFRNRKNRQRKYITKRIKEEINSIISAFIGCICPVLRIHIILFLQAVAYIKFHSGEGDGT